MEKDNNYRTNYQTDADPAWSPNTVRVMDSDWIVQFSVCYAGVRGDTLAILWRCKRRNHVGHDSEGWRSCIDSAGLFDLLFKKMERFEHMMATESTRREVKMTVTNALLCLAYRNELVTLVRSRVNEYPYEGI